MGYIDVMISVLIIADTGKSGNTGSGSYGVRDFIFN